MVSYNEHLKRILAQIIDSYNTLKEIQDKPGGLDNIKLEILKINGFLKVSVNTVDEYKITVSDFKGLRTKFSHYLKNYFFEQEIETMTLLYSDDTLRIKNMRLKIIEALEDNEMIDDITEIIAKL